MQLPDNNTLPPFLDLVLGNYENKILFIYQMTLVHVFSSHILSPPWCQQPIALHRWGKKGATGAALVSSGALYHVLQRDHYHPLFKTFFPDTVAQQYYATVIIRRSSPPTPFHSERWFCQKWKDSPQSRQGSASCLLSNMQEAISVKIANTTTSPALLPRALLLSPSAAEILFTKYIFWIIF